MHVTGVLSHGHHRAWAFLSGDEVFHDSNLTIECLHRVLLDLAQLGPLPRKLFLQLDKLRQVTSPLSCALHLPPPL